jgi:exopolysaccharide biosynthesis polyprenyl glycosylphosphotransferase
VFATVRGAARGFVVASSTKTAPAAIHVAKPSILESRFLRRYFVGLARVTQALVDVLAVFAACLTAYAIWARMQPHTRVPPLSDYLPIFGGIAAIVFLLFIQFGMYRSQKSILNIEEFKGVLKTCVLGFLLAVGLQFVLEESAIGGRGAASSPMWQVLLELHEQVAVVPANTYSRFVVLLAFVLAFFFLSIERWVSFKCLQYLHLRGIGTSNILIIGTAQPARILQKRLFLSPRLGFNLVGFVDDDPALVGQAIGKSRVVGTTDRLVELVQRFKVGQVLVACADIDKTRLAGLAETCRALDVEIAFIPPFVLSGDLPPLRLSSIELTPVLTFSPVKPGPGYRFGKRLCDILASSFGLLVNLPMFVLLPILIKLESPGPALFRQTRVGKDGKPFEILKFRTMRVDAPKYATTPRSGDDPRLTRLGKFLRRTSIDELPQLLNVLRGDMSIVGPRPEMPFIVDNYDPYVRQRLNAKPGMTGLWQISHARDEDIHENVDYDLYYVQHPSLTMDVMVLMLTVFSVMRGVGAH